MGLSMCYKKEQVVVRLMTEDYIIKFTKEEKKLNKTMEDNIEIKYDWLKLKSYITSLIIAMDGNKEAIDQDEELLKTFDELFMEYNELKNLIGSKLIFEIREFCEKSARIEGKIRGEEKSTITTDY